MSGLTPDIVMSMLKNGIRQSEIARTYGVSRQYVNKLAKQGGHEPIVTVVSENMPWVVPSEYYGNTLYQGLRLIAHANYGGYETLTGSSLAKIRALLKKLIQFHLVIDFDPSYPAVPTLTNTPGFAYVPRTEVDEDFMIKIKPGVRITPEGDKMWRLPKTMP